MLFMLWKHRKWFRSANPSGSARVEFSERLEARVIERRIPVRWSKTPAPEEARFVDVDPPPLVRLANSDGAM